VEDRARERESRAHTGGVATHALSERVGDPEALGGFLHSPVDFAPVHLEQRRRVREVVATGQAVVERGTGGDHAAPAADLRAFVVEVGIEPEGADRAGVRAERAGDEADDRGLAGAVRAQQHRDGAAGHVEVEPVDRDYVTEAASDSGERDGGIGSHTGVSARSRGG
jgi:hypothetical protein